MSTKITPTVNTSTKDSLGVTLKSTHSATVNVSGFGFGVCTALGGTLQYNSWNDFVNRKTNAQVYVGKRHFWIWFSIAGRAVAFYEGETSGLAAFSGEGEVTWT